MAARHQANVKVHSLTKREVSMFELLKEIGRPNRFIRGEKKNPLGKARRLRILCRLDTRRIYYHSVGALFEKRGLLL